MRIQRWLAGLSSLGLLWLSASCGPAGPVLVEKGRPRGGIWKPVWLLGEQ